MIKPVVLIGGGGHCKACIDVLLSAEREIRGILDKEEGKKIAGYPVIGSDDNIEELVREGVDFLITIGQIQQSAPRVRLFENILNHKGSFTTVVSSQAILGLNCSLGKGTIIMHQALVNVEARVGDNCIINNKALIEHDAVIGDHSHISTGAIVNGGCKVGNRVFVGSNSVLAHGVVIADDVVIGAGSVVIKNIDQPGVYAGNPVRKIQ